MPSKANPDSLGFILTETSRLLRTALERRIAAQGLDVTPAEARALVYVASAEGSRQNAIAERMGVEPMTVCAYLDRLEKLGLVTRQPDPNDRRAKNVRTTGEADRLIASVRQESAELYEEILKGLDATSREVLIAGLKMVRGNLQAVLADKPGAETERTEARQ